MKTPHSSNKQHEIPTILSKYYNISLYSVEAITQHYLYASHPLELNDVYDCCSQWLSYKNVSNDTIQNLTAYANIPNHRETETNQKLRNAIFEEFVYKLTFCKMGIISLTNEHTNMLMWAYYTQNKGFCVRFNTRLLQTISEHEYFHTPFPIEYIDTIEPQEFDALYPYNNVYAMASKKFKVWSHEQEWRIIAESNFEKSIPNQNIEGINDSRLFYYNPAAIHEIILGFNFFDVHSEVLKRENGITYLHITDELKISLLDYIIQHAITVTLMHGYKDAYSLAPVALTLHKTKERFYECIL